ncbi:MAG TPA: VWA domain-containing protein [Candidatus Limnocylindrales bacterium]|nr:VWA domain-containing protein [Candidatus Limnocylindrales bacterium]
MTFAHPYLLLLLLLLPLAAWLKGRRGSPPAFLYSSVRLVAGLTGVRRSRVGALLAALRWLVLALFILALAQPRLTKSTTEVKASGIDIVVALDLSGSMNTPDYEVSGQRISRFNLAKSVLEKFVGERPDDRIGLVVFAARAFLASPLTLDHDFLLDNIDRLEIGTINSDATAIGDGLVTALNQLRDLKAKSKIIVLMTDGGNNSGQIDPDTAAAAAAALGVKVFTVGLGNRELVQAMGLPPGYLPDDDALQKISQTTGGTFYRAENSEKLRQIYAEINRMEKTEAVVNKFTEYQELFPWFISSGLVLLLLEITLGQTVLRKLP